MKNFSFQVVGRELGALQGMAMNSVRRTGPKNDTVAKINLLGCQERESIIKLLFVV